MNTTPLDAEQLSEKLQYLFRGLAWLHGKATRYLVLQLFMVATCMLFMHLHATSLFVTIPYVAFSVITVSACAFLFFITQGAADLEENIREIKSSALDASQHVSKTKNDTSKDSFKIKKLIKHAAALSSLHGIKDISLDVKDNILSLARVFTPLTGLLLIAVFLTSFIQVFIAILTITFIVPA